MPPRSKVFSLPPALKDELDRRLVQGGFSGYEALEAWLAEHGARISASAIHRYGQAFEARLGALKLATEQARVIAEELGDGAGDLGEALTAVAQQKTFDLLMDLEVDAGEVPYDKLITAIARLNQAGVQQKRWRAEVSKRARAAADEAEQIARTGGLSDEAAEAIRAKILGVVA